jgi:hypothetical protein
VAVVVDEDVETVVVMGVVLCCSGRAQALVLGKNTRLAALLLLLLLMPTVEACGVLLLVGPLISRKKVLGEVAKVLFYLLLNRFFFRDQSLSKSTTRILFVIP